MSNPPLIAVQEHDNKGDAWREAIAAGGGKALPFRNSGQALFCIWRCLRTYGQHPDRIVIRYLNCRKTFTRSLVFLLSELTVYVYARVAGIDIRWVCHNVDRETIVRYPRLSRARRWLASRFASRVFVTHPLLLGEAVRELRLPAYRLDVAPMGPPHWKHHERTNPAFRERLAAYAREAREVAASENKHALIGLCAGRVGPKYLHIDLAAALASAEDDQFKVFLVLVGDFAGEDTRRWNPGFQQAREASQILVHDCYTQLNEFELTEHFDFFWRGYDDLSLSYTLITASAVEKPVLAVAQGFVGRLVEHDGLGATVRADFTDVHTALRALSRWRRPNRPLSELYDWDRGARKLAGPGEASGLLREAK